MPNVAPRYSIHVLAAAQYSSYLLVGVSYFFIFGAMARAVSNPLVGLGAVLVPLVLGGYASALSFIMPRAAAVLALTCSVPYLILGVPGLFRGVIQANRFVVVTSAAVMAVSLVAFFWNEGSVWRRLTTKFGKIAVLVISGYRHFWRRGGSVHSCGGFGRPTDIGPPDKSLHRIVGSMFLNLIEAAQSPRPLNSDI